MIGIMVAKLSEDFRICEQGGLFPTPAELMRHEKMNRKYYFFFKVLAFFLVGFPLSVVSPKLAFSDEPLIIGHTCTDISQIPESGIDQAKSNLHIAYGHTSHGSQLTTGMTGLVGFANNGGLGLSFPTEIFAWNNGGTGGALDLHDYAMGGDCGYYPQWVNNTRNYLGDPDPITGRGTTNPDVNVIVWSWCGQVDNKYAAGTLDSEYLTPMSQLETDYPGVKFIYMTGHMDHWDDSNNKAANQMVRDYCISNNKVLYDFADIESYDPDGAFYEFPNDSCDYYESISGPKLGNWAIEWQNSHTEDVDWYDCTSAHSQPLNANRKAYAAWWLWARLAGWNPSGAPVANFSGTPTTGTAPLEVSFIDSSTGDIDSRSWTFGDGGSSTAQHPTYTYDDPGTYTVRLTVTGPSGSDTETENNYITVTEAPVPPVANFSGTPTTGMAPLEVSFTDSSTGDIDSWSWSFGDGGSSTAQNLTYTYDDPGTYTVALEVTGPGGIDTRTRTNYITVTAAPQPPVADFSGTLTTGMAPLQVSFTDSSTGDIDSRSWTFGDGGTSTDQNPTYTYNDPGAYTISLTVTGPGGMDTEIKNNYITVTSTPPEYTLTVNTVGSGIVTLNPPGGNYEAGTVVQMTAVPGGGGGTEGMFTGWSGGLSGSNNPETITMDSDKTVTATFIEIGVQSGDLTSMSCVNPGSIEDSPDKPDDFPYGLIEMEIAVTNAGDQAIITVYLPNAAHADYKWHKYILSGEWIDFDRDVISDGSGDGAVFNVDRTEVTLYITDNGQYDDDPTPMVIRDPSGLGFLTASSSGDSGSSGGSGGGGCFIVTVGSGPPI